jgi:hypothetical protein
MHQQVKRPCISKSKDRGARSAAVTRKVTSADHPASSVLRLGRSKPLAEPVRSVTFIFRRSRNGGIALGPSLPGLFELVQTPQRLGQELPKGLGSLMQ